MSTLVWTTFAVAAMVGIFAVCVVVVEAGIRVVEAAVEKRRGKDAA